MDGMAVVGIAIGVIGAIFGYFQVRRDVNSAIAQAAEGIQKTFSRRRADVRRRLGKRAAPYVVGCFSYPPVSSVEHADPRGEPTFGGPFVELFGSIANAMNFDVEYRFISASEFSTAKDVSADMILGLFETPHRRPYFNFSLPLYRIRLQGICRRDQVAISKEDLISGKLRVIVQSGEVGWEYVQEQMASLMGSTVRAYPFMETVEASRMLLTGDYEVAISDELSCWRFLAANENREHFRLAFDWPLPSFTGCVAVRKGVPIDLQRMNELIKEMRNTPAFLQSEANALAGYEKVVERLYLNPGYVAGDAPAPQT